jgi:predicted RNA binding protein YcfA (HicA-like mRNA interferase family)
VTVIYESKPIPAVDLLYSGCYTSVMAGEKRFRDVRKMLEAKGYNLARISGSHHIFTKPGALPVSVPVHHGKVKPAYVRQIEKL